MVDREAWEADLRPASARGRRRTRPSIKTTDERLTAIEERLRELTAAIDQLRTTVDRMAAAATEAQGRTGWFRSGRHS
jgi:hypothetical protein